MRFPGCSRNVIAVFLALLFLGAGVVPTALEAKTTFTARRTFTTLFLGGSGYLAIRAWDYRREANKLYDRYRSATTANEATDLFKRTSDRDTKSQISVVISTALLVAGVRLLLMDGSEKEGEESLKFTDTLGLDISGFNQQKGLGIKIRKNF